jgi:hypothetical protein
VDQHIHRALKDEEGALFARVLKQAGRGLDGQSQGVYLFAADGKLLAFSNTADGEHVKHLLTTALRKFDPDGVSADLGSADKKSSPFPEPPAGGLVIDVATKVLGGYEGAAAERYGQSLGRDHLWLRKDEAEALARGTLTETAARRLVRFHLVDNTRGEPPMWRDDEIRKLELTLRDGRLSGVVHLETKSGDRGYRAELLGAVEVKDGRVTRLDLVARGQFWGEGTFTRGAPKGKFPVAIAFTLASGQEPADRVPPQAARGNAAAYLR